MVTETSIKQETIIEAAMRRFSHFGINKTTLSEIAKGLNISKASLFYYFNDKQALVIAVFDKLLNDFFSEFRLKITDLTTAEEALLYYIDSKHEAFRKNMQLALQSGSIQLDRSSPQLLKLIAKAQSTTTSIICDLLDKGVKENELQPLDTKKVARLMLDTIQSHEICLKHSSPFPSEKDFNDLAKKQKDTVRLFFNGLKNHALSHN